MKKNLIFALLLLLPSIALGDRNDYLIYFNDSHNYLNDIDCPINARGNNGIICPYFQEMVAQKLNDVNVTLHNGSLAYEIDENPRPWAIFRVNARILADISEGSLNFEFEDVYPSLDRNIISSSAALRYRARLNLKGDIRVHTQQRVVFLIRDHVDGSVRIDAEIESLLLTDARLVETESEYVLYFRPIFSIFIVGQDVSVNISRHSSILVTLLSGITSILTLGFFDLVSFAEEEGSKAIRNESGRFFANVTNQVNREIQHRLNLDSNGYGVIRVPKPKLLGSFAASSIVPPTTHVLLN